MDVLFKESVDFVVFLKRFKGWLYIKIFFIELYMIILNLCGENNIFGIKIFGYFVFCKNENIMVLVIVWFVMFGCDMECLILMIFFFLIEIEIKNIVFKVNFYYRN